MQQATGRKRVLRKLDIASDCFWVHGGPPSEADDYYDYWAGFWKAEGDVEISDDGISDEGVVYVLRTDLQGLILQEEQGIPVLYLRLKGTDVGSDRYIGGLYSEGEEPSRLQRHELETWLGLVKRHYLDHFGMEI